MFNFNLIAITVNLSFKKQTKTLYFFKQKYLNITITYVIISLSSKYCFIFFRAKAHSKDSTLSPSNNNPSNQKERPKSWHATKHDNSLVTTNITSQYRNSGETYKMKSNLMTQQKFHGSSNVLTQHKFRSRGWKESGDLVYKGSRDSLLSNHNSAVSTSSKMSTNSSVLVFYWSL